MYLRHLTFGLAAAFLPALAFAAPLTQTTTATFSGGTNIQSVTDGASSGNTVPTLATAALPAINLSQFNIANGVLIAVDLGLTSTRTQSGSGSGNGGTGSRTATGSGATAGTSITAPGVTQSFGDLSNSGSCTSTSNCSFSVAASNAATNATMSVNAASLGTYAGAGTVALTRAATLSALILRGGYSNGSYTYTLNWNGSLSATYSYLAHANGSFAGGSDSNELVIDFGDVDEDSVVAPIAFAISNFGAAGETTGLDLDSIGGSGDTGVLTTDLAGFANMGVGSMADFLALIDTSEAGAYEAQYMLTLSDANGTGVGQAENFLTLTLRGHVVAAPQNDPPVRQLLVATDVPEPATLALLALGVAGLAAARRRAR